ncbi:hypothetical protein BBJ29_009699 [Phytophthora kernoviae]|uniref:WRKY19-like zinc finger domain-containing protein n=1 Tax=Phytophthora kernoviae TaxID=325452 RepID=A0A3F2RTA3_9STRA|nr:hypothetical protein BBJ29_009699 [Phytophthora kernoviae]RLN63840.1 hypothetical protein BBP00_00003831 [Phytophthora kernoviae]
MEAEEEEREVATASAALFGGAEGETRFDDDGMDGSELPSSFTMPLLTRDEEEDAESAGDAAERALPLSREEEGEKQTVAPSHGIEESVNRVNIQENQRETEEAIGTPPDTEEQVPATDQQTPEQASDVVDRRGYQCRFEKCSKFAQAGGLCISHGGGYRCQTPFCAFFNLRTCPDHGGSKRCSVTGCTRVALGTSALCCAHGGGRKCSVKKCEKYDAGQGFCLSHGGGRECTANGCSKKAIRYGLCSGHGGRARCKVEGCTKFDRGQATAEARSVMLKDARHPVWEVGGASFTEVVDGARLKIVATGHSMVADAKITVAQASAAHAAVVINTIKEVVTASLTVVDLHAPSWTAPRNKYNGIFEYASDDAVRMVESHDAL